MLANNTETCYNIDIGKEVKPLKKLRKIIKKWLPIITAFIQLAIAIIELLKR
nr:MAG TPA: hypothetical protein [Caudoviricetes sp.]